MPEETSTMNPGGGANGAWRGEHRPSERMLLLALNRRLPKGRILPEYAVEYFNQLVAQYVILPDTEKNARNANAVAVAESLITEQDAGEQEKRIFRWPWERRRRYLNWGDVSGLELALLQLMPGRELERFAWNLRARYHEIAGQGWYDFYRQSGPPGDACLPAKEKAADAPTVVVTSTPAGTVAGHVLLMPPAPAAVPAAPAEKDAGGDSPATALLRADMGVLLSDLQRLRSTIQAREEKRSEISRLAAFAAAFSLLIALTAYGISGHYGGAIVRPAISAPAAGSPGTPSTTHAPPGPIAPGKPGSTPSPPSSAPLSTAPDILQTAALVILCGVLGGLISMLRRLQEMPTGSTPLIDTVALNAGQFGIGLAPVYGGIFAMLLYLIFLSRLLDSILAPTAQAAVFPLFNDATPASTPDAARLLVWAFVAGFAEKLVPDVLNRLTAKNAAPAQAKLLPVSGASPAPPA